MTSIKILSGCLGAGGLDRKTLQLLVLNDL